jgi:hypothetical protein
MIRLARSPAATPTFRPRTYVQTASRVPLVDQSGSRRRQDPGSAPPPLCGTTLDGEEWEFVSLLVES